MSLRFLNRYSLSLSIMAGCLFLPAVGLTAPSFTSNEEKTLGILPNYYLCMKQAKGNEDTYSNCEGVEFEYQDWRLNTAYKALMKELSPAEQKTLRKKERNWLKKRNTLCSRKDADKPGSLPCGISTTARQAGVLENLLKEHRK